jgi:hypothetical protein
MPDDQGQRDGQSHLGVDLRYDGAFGSGLSSGRQPAIEL